jgi:8-oxo-dGTP pyrophosphatase MutT (NUDIX family)
VSALAKQEKNRLFTVNAFAGVIIKYKNSVLLGKRANNGCAYPGYWSIPAGAVEGDEPYDACAERELFEETGILLEEPLIYLCEFKDESGVFYVYLYEAYEMCLPDPDAKDAYEHTEWGYFSIDDNTLPEPISKEIKESILKIKK